jgi:uncharacterized protein (DUF302 family)
MKMEHVAYIVETEASHGDAVAAVLRTVEEKSGWAVLDMYDLSDHMAARGFNTVPIVIIEVTSVQRDFELLQKNVLTSLFMPWRIVVIELDSGKTVVAAIRPVVIPQLFLQISESEVERIERDIEEIVHATLSESS